MTARRRLSDVIRLGVVGTVTVALAASYAAFRVIQQGDRDEQQQADAIVVLGAAQYDGRPSPVFKARLDHAVGLYEAGVAPLLVVTGGKAEGDRTTEAAVARRYAESHAVPASAIIGEDQGRNTLESLEGVAALLKERDLRRVVFVSDRLHMLRVLRIAQDLGIEAYGSPTATSPTDEGTKPRVEALVHELGALAAYFVTGGTPLRDPPRG